MNCPECLDRLQRALDERGDVPADAALAAHLSSCPACRETFAAAESLHRGLRLLPSPRPPAAFSDVVVLRILRERRLDRTRLVLRVAAALLMGAIGLSFAILSANHPEPVRRIPAGYADRDSVAEPPPSLQAQLTEARAATFGLTRQLALDTSRGARLLFPPADQLPDPVAPLNLEPPAMSVQEVSRNVAVGFEPVTDSAKRAWSMFRRMVPGDDRKKS